MPCKQLFQFKKFSICQDDVAMKVGTDGVLLGAWASHTNPNNILDIGTGTGLIALMLAQRYPNASIQAIEIEKKAFEKALLNINESNWKSRIKAFHTPLQSFNPQTNYDLIACNPPYFNEKVMANSHQRQWARQDIKMKMDDLFAFAKKHLNEEGILSLIYPKNKESNLMEISKIYDLFPQKILNIRGNDKAKTKRILLSFGRKKAAINTIEELIIEKRRHCYTTAYKALVKDFYLKM